jgi:hypothetical protein
MSIIPAFASIPDRAMAEACSEMFDGSYTSTLFDEAQNQYGPDDLFPPKSSELLCVQAAYLASPQSRERTIGFASLTSDEAFPSKADIMSLYDELVGSVQTDAQNFAHPDGVRQWYVDRVRQEEKLLLAAYIMCRVRESKLIVAALALPKVIEQESRFWWREQVVEVLPSLDAATTEAAKPLLRGEVSRLGNMAASLFLRSPNEFQKDIAPYLGRRAQARRKISEARRRKNKK